MPYEEISFIPTDYSTEWMFEDRITQAGVSDEQDKQPLKEKNRKNAPHVPHNEKPPQVVAKRNARERRRVHAVNMAFVRLRKMIPMRNSRGKRISKVKTLQSAIKYIKELEIILQERQYFEPYMQYDEFHSFSSTLDIKEDF